MVFGYYHITMRSVKAQDFPELDFPSNVEIEQKVKVGHMLWIPFFPLDKLWAIDINNETYKLGYKAERVIEDKLGTKSYPWYSFLGFILIGAFIIIAPIFAAISSSISEKNRHSTFEKNRDYYNSKVESPETDDLFFFKDNRNKVVLKVESNDQDSIYFKGPVDNENKRWTKSGWPTGFYRGNNPTKNLAVAKSDLKTSFKQNYEDNMYKKGMPAGQLPLVGPIQLEKVQAMKKENTNANVVSSQPYVSETAFQEVKDGFKYFASQCDNLDSLIALMDVASYQFYQDQLIEASKSDDVIVKKLKNYDRSNSFMQSKNSLYELLMYTKFVYLKAGEGQEADPNRLTEAMTDMSGYMFFLKLLDKGFLSLENKQIKEAVIKDVQMSDENTAKVTLSAMSNLLKKPKLTGFVITMKKEKGRWKVNIPSGYSYTENQLRNMMLFDNVGNVDQEWRQMVRSNVKEIDPTVKIPTFWEY